MSHKVVHGICIVLSIAILSVGVIIEIKFIDILQSCGFVLADTEISMPETGNVGDFIGGVVGTLFSLASIILLLLTLRDQNHQYKRDRLGQTFYEMLHIHNDNVVGMNLKDAEKTLGRDAFTKLLDDYEVIYDLVESSCNNILKQIPDDSKNSSKIADMQHCLKLPNVASFLYMRIAYGFFFYGSEYFELKSPQKVENDILEHVKYLLSLGNNVVKPHNVLLGHYYRHMYQILQLISKASFLDEQEKYEYAKQLRAQLNDDEQVLLYYNSLSDIGHAWIDKLGEKKREKMCLMARYRMIKNIPYYKTIKGVQPQNLFVVEIAAYKKRHESFFETER